MSLDSPVNLNADRDRKAPRSDAADSDAKTKKGREPVQLAAFWLEALWMAWSPPKARSLRQPSQRERRNIER